MHPTRPPMASQARASARFSSLTTATTSTSMTDTSSSYWASSQPKRHKYRSYASSAGNEGFGSPGTDMTSPGTSSEHKFGSGDEKGFPGFALRDESTAEQSTQSSSDGDNASSMEEPSGGLDRMLDEEIDRLSSVSSASPHPVSMAPSLTSDSSSIDLPSTTSSPMRRRDSSISPSRTSRSASTKSHSTTSTSFRQSRPPRRMTHALYPNLSPTSENSYDEIAVISFASRQQWDDGLSTIREERKHSLSILEGHGRIASSDSVSGGTTRAPPSEVAGDTARFADTACRSHLSLLPSPAISSSAFASGSTSGTKPLNLRSSPALRDRISMFEGRSTGSEAPSTPRSGYFVKRDLTQQAQSSPSPSIGVKDIFSPVPASGVLAMEVKSNIASGSDAGTMHTRMPAESAGSPWLPGPGSIPPSTVGSSAIGGMATPRHALTNNSAPEVTGLGFKGEFDTIAGTSSRSSRTSLRHGEYTPSPGLSKRSSLTRTPTRTRNLVGQCDLIFAAGLGEGPIPRGDGLSRAATAVSSTATQRPQSSIRRGAGGLKGMAPRRTSGQDVEKFSTSTLDPPPASNYSPHYLNNKPLPPLHAPSNAVPAFVTPPRPGASSYIHRHEPEVMLQMPTYSPYSRSRTVTPTRPTLLSNSFGPSTTGSILIPEFPVKEADRWPPTFHAACGRSPMSKSPLKDFMGALANVKDKVKLAGRKRAGTLDKEPSDLLRVDFRGPNTYTPGHGSSDAARLGSTEREITAGFGRTTVVRVPASEAGHSYDASLSLKSSETDLLTGAVRMSAAVYLQPTPCSSLSPWGDWHYATAYLTMTGLIFDCAGERHSMDLTHCAEVRSLRREEARRKNLPPVAVADDSEAYVWCMEEDRGEILELTFEDGTRTYFGVEGISGRLGWVTALWDAILASRSTPALCTPRSPSISSCLPAKRFVSTTSIAPPAMSPITATRSQDAPVSMENMVPPGGLPDVPSSESSKERHGSTAGSDDNPDVLTDNVRAMFDIGPNGSPLRTGGNTAWMLAPADYQSQQVAEDEWIPAERQLSVFGVMERSVPEMQYLRADVPDADGCAASDTSFDENDLNPSRSASQRRRRSPTVVARSPIVRHSSVSHPPEDRVQRHLSSSTVRPIPTIQEQLKETPTSRPLPQPLTTAQLLPWKRAPKVLTMPGPLGSSNTDQVEPPQSFPSPHHFNGDLDGVFPLPRSATPLEETRETSRLKYSVPSTEIPAVPMSPHANQEDVGLVEQGHQEGVALNGVAATSETSGLYERLSILHNDVAQRLGNIQETMPTLTMQEANATDLRHIAGGLDGFGTDLKGLRDSMAMTQATIAATAEAGPLDLREVYTKLDAIVSVLREKSEAEVIARQEVQVPSEPKEPSTQSSAMHSMISDGSTLASPATKSVSAELPSLDNALMSSKQAQNSASGVTDEMVNQLSEVLASVKTLQAARETQDQQTSDMARYLGQLNGWLEKFVLNGTSEIQAMAGKVDRLTKELAPEAPPRDPDAPEGTPEPMAPLGLPGLVREVHNMAVQQQQRAEGEAIVAQRVDALISMLGEDRQRAAQQQSTFESVLSVLEQQRAEHELLLRALATDLTAEIRGEKGKFIEAMREATSVNVNLHVEDFKKMLNQEVTKNMHELAAMREQKKALEMVISDLFAIKAKHTDGPPITRPVLASAPPPASPPVTPARMAAPPRSPAPSNLGPRALPRAPGH